MSDKPMSENPISDNPTPEVMRYSKLSNPPAL